MKNTDKSNSPVKDVSRLTREEMNQILGGNSQWEQYMVGTVNTNGNPLAQMQQELDEENS